MGLLVGEAHKRAVDEQHSELVLAVQEVLVPLAQQAERRGALAFNFYAEVQSLAPAVRTLRCDSREGVHQFLLSASTCEVVQQCGVHWISDYTNGR